MKLRIISAVILIIAFAGLTTYWRYRYITVDFRKLEPTARLMISKRYPEADPNKLHFRHFQYIDYLDIDGTHWKYNWYQYYASNPEEAKSPSGEPITMKTYEARFYENGTVEGIYSGSCTFNPRYLVNNGADVNGKTGSTSLMAAIETGHSEVAERLIKNGAEKIKTPPPLGNLVKITCIRCNGDPEKKKNCSLCNGYGYMWVDANREDLSPAIRKLVEESRE
jgi:ankyrin repeat protein